MTLATTSAPHPGTTVTTTSHPDELVVSHLGLARALAARYRHRGVAFDDLVQIATLGLVKAAHRYSPDHGNRFAAYATPTVVGELRRYFRDHGWCVRPPRRLQELRAQLLVEDDPRLPEEEIARRIGASVAELREVRQASAGYTPVSLDAPHDEDGTVLDVLSSGEDAMATVDELESLHTAVGGLTGRERHILFLRFYEDATQSEIAAELGVSQMQVSRLLAGILTRLRADLGVHVPVREVGTAVRRRSAADGAPAWSRMPSSSSTSTSRAA